MGETGLMCASSGRISLGMHGFSRRHFHLHFFGRLHIPSCGLVEKIEKAVGKAIRPRIESTLPNNGKR